MNQTEKIQYWKNRKAGKRGQGEKPKIIGRHYSPVMWKDLKSEEKMQKFIEKEMVNVSN